MKRLIKYHNIYSSDGAQFSTCSTRYEVLPVLLPDTAGNKELRAAAMRLGIRLKGNVTAVKPAPRGYRDITVTHAVKVDETVKAERWRQAEEYRVYLGLVDLSSFENKTLAPVESVNNDISDDDAFRIEDAQHYGVMDTGETVDGGVVLVMDGWHYYHQMPLLGYSLSSFEKARGVTEHGFHDDTEQCSNCGLYDSSDNGYTYNFRYLESAGNLGINCGCYAKHCQNNVEDFANNTDTPIELEDAKKLQKQGRLQFVERFIGGMTDGRGGYWYGKGDGSGYCREGTPAKVLAELLAKEPKSEFVFTHDESGQFQTYFSVWRLMPEVQKKHTTKRKAG